MQLEFNYELADLREAYVPARFATAPAKYERRWIFAVVAWTIVASFVALYLWIDHVQSVTAQFQDQRLVRHFRGDLVPVLFPAFFTYAVYVLTACKLWRDSRKRRSAATISEDRFGQIAGIVTGGLLASLGCVAVQGRDFTWYPTSTQNAIVIAAPWITLFAVMQLLGFMQRRAKVLGPWRNNPAWQVRKTMLLDEREFRIRDAFSDLSFKWPYFTGVRETANLILVIDHGGAKYVIPKRVFTHPSDLEQCRSLLQNVVPNTRFLVKPVGFAVIPNPVRPLPQLGNESSSSSTLTTSHEPGTMQPANELEP